MRRSFRTPRDVGQGSQGVALGWYAVSLRDTGNVQNSTRDKTRASCLELIRIIRDEVVVHAEGVPSNTKITEKSIIETATTSFLSKVQPGVSPREKGYHNEGVLKERRIGIVRSVCLFE